MRDQLYCNGCGKEIKVVDGILQEDVFEGKKQWGYFSKKDGQIHEFYLCETCYDQMILKLKMKPKVTEATEL